MEQANRVDLGALQDGKLHLMGFCGGKFVYLSVDPNGSEYVIYQTLSDKFPVMVMRMLGDLNLVEPN